MTTHDKRMYDFGYTRGRGGHPIDWDLARRSAAYQYGWEDGDSDRPTLDEVTLDVAKERTDPLGY